MIDGFLVGIGLVGAAIAVLFASVVGIFVLGMIIHFFRGGPK
jgi:hypothetical protein